MGSVDGKPAAKIFVEDVNYIDGYIFYKRFESTKPSGGEILNMSPMFWEGRGVTKEE